MTETEAQIQRAAHVISARWRMTSLDALESMLAVCEGCADERARPAVETICAARALSHGELATLLQTDIQRLLEDEAARLEIALPGYLGGEA